MFHSREGLFFRRNSDGTVTVRLERAPWRNGRGQLVKEVTLEDGEWASAVSSVSAGGETGERWQRALAFHNGT